jgi:hypothetical protein
MRKVIALLGSATILAFSVSARGTDLENQEKHENI